MAIFRVNKIVNFTTIDNNIFKNKKLSNKSKGLLCTILSLPDTWDYSIEGLVAICKDNETAIKTELKELKENGYLTITKKMPNETTSGRIEYEYNIFEIPKQESKKQEVEILGLEILEVENQGQLNTKELNTNKLNNTNTTIYDFLEMNFGRGLTPIEYEQVEIWEDTELTRYAIKQAVLNGKYNIKYIDRILQNYKINNIQTIQQAQEEEQNFKESKTKKYTPRRNNTFDPRIDVEENIATPEEIEELERKLKL